MRLIKPDQQEIVKVTRLFLKLWNDRNLQLSLTGELIAEQGLTSAVVVIFFGHIVTSVHSKEQVLLYAGPKSPKVARFRATKSKSLQIRNKKIGESFQDSPMVRVTGFEPAAS